MLLAALLGGYTLGAIPFGILIARALGLGDLRSIGSGNIGATNVLRTGNKAAAAATLLFDAGKGAIAVLIATAYWGETAGLIAGLGAFLGHLFPVWLSFKGGKGVATFLGILLVVNFWAGLATCMTWLVVAIALRISSLSALIAAALSPIWLWVFGTPDAAWLALVMSLLIWFKHSPNIRRLLKGEEPRIGGAKPVLPQDPSS